MDRLEKALRKLKDIELLQYGVFPLAGDKGRVQIVISSPYATKRDVLTGKYSLFEAIHPRTIAEKKMRKVLEVCKQVGTDHELRLVVKSLNIGVIEALYSVEAVKAYQKSDSLETIANSFHCASKFT